MSYQRLGDLLVSVGVITNAQLEEALALQKESKERLGTVLIQHGFITEKQLIESLTMQLGIEFIDLTKYMIPPEMAKLLSKNIAKKYSLVPVKLVKDTLYIAMTDPLNFMAIGDVKAATRKKIVPMIATQEAVDRAIIVLYGNEGAARAIEEMKREAQNELPGTGMRDGVSDDVQSAPTVRLVNSIIERAVSERASDIHLEPREENLYVRMRVDGMMRNTLTVPKKLENAVIARLKVMSGMDISERKIPQDGRANVRVKQSDIDVRASTLPTIFGEKMVLRLLDKSGGMLNKKSIGMTGDDLSKYEKLLGNASGVILIVGPTGSGKSSTMYTMIQELNRENVNLVTLEDPVEYQIDGVNQVQINEKTGMSFSSGLRSILRQDPDIVCVGEIRDSETAEIAMRAALTGHLVISTLHTNDAITSIDRLEDMDVPPYLIASSLKGVISQRLVRRICPHCREAYTPSREELEAVGIHSDEALTLYRGKGCADCFHTGYRGRIGVFEILMIDRELRMAVSEGATRLQLEQIAERNGFISLPEQCRKLVLAGVTTAEDAIRTINTTVL